MPAPSPGPHYMHAPSAIRRTLYARLTPDHIICPPITEITLYARPINKITLYTHPVTNEHYTSARLYIVLVLVPDQI